MPKPNSFCINCGNTLKPTAKFCGSCGTKKDFFDDNDKDDTYRRSINKSLHDKQFKFKYGIKNVSRKNETTTLLLSIILGLFGILGVGYLYLGLGRGIVWLIGGFVLWIGTYSLWEAVLAPSPYVTMFESEGWGIAVIMAIVLYTPPFIWQIRDSRRACRRYNEYYGEFHKKPNW
jgi:hypothetical protein